MWDGEVLHGPVPALYSEDIKETEDALKGRKIKPRSASKNNIN